MSSASVPPSRMTKRLSAVSSTTGASSAGIVMGCCLPVGAVCWLATLKVYNGRGMSGPVATDDVPPSDAAIAAPAGIQADGPVVEIAPGRLTQVGSLPVRRVLPQRPRRTVGSWCFVDHAGPVRRRTGRGVRHRARIPTWASRP